MANWEEDRNKFEYLGWRVKYGRIAQPKRVVFDRSLFCQRGYNIWRCIPLVFFYAAHKIILCCVAGDHQAFPPTHPRRGGREGSHRKLPVQPSYLSFHPSRATVYKSDLPSIRILSYGSVALLLCSLLVALCGVGSRAVRRRPPHMGRATAYRGGKQS